MQNEKLIEKINGLAPERVAEVEDFVDFISQRDERRLVQAAAKLSEDAFRQVWDNEEDSVYDQL
ncbi:MAG: toxin-antitoxin system, antitoxin component, Xre family protein [Pyrinomonadaceae bacterium]|nr:toxin-antitoxin system, antitoxin component, Xre family protein [Pyrinomonadaceae bacterium]